MKCVICGKEIEKSLYSNDTLCSDECFSKHYWLERVNRQDVKTQVVVNHNVYQIEDENSSSSFRGFYGAPFYIEFFDGRKVRTTNLWANGEIPDEFKDQLPDNAKFITKDEYEGLNTNDGEVLDF